jgi:DNA-binding PadR family transcriptional regulator
MVGPLTCALTVRCHAELADLRVPTSCQSSRVTRFHRLLFLTDLDKISVMAGPDRVTGPLLDVLEIMVRALQNGGHDPHGWAIMKATKRSGPTVYGVLDRLEDLGWIEGAWEDPHPDKGIPRRRFYRLTPTGDAGARELLRERRPEALQQTRRQQQGWRALPGQAGVS